MSEATDNTKTLANALARIEALEAEKAHLLKVIKGRKVAGSVRTDWAGNVEFYARKESELSETLKPVYYISDEYDAAGILITPEVKIEQ